MADNSGPIETAFVEIKPKISPTFAADIRREILPVLKQLSAEGAAAFREMGRAATGANASIKGVARAIQSAEQASASFAKSAERDAAKVGAAYAAAGAEAKRSFEEANRASGGASKGAGRASAAFGLLGGSAKIAGAAGVTALVAMTTYGVKAAASLEQTKIAFRGILGNVQVADAFTARLQKFAAVTPFDFPELAKATQKLLALGMTGDQAIATLTTVGDAAAAVGADSVAINRVVIALAQIQAKGKLTQEELNQVAEALPNLNRAAVVQKLADAYGVTTQQIQKLQQKGLIPAKEGTAALLAVLKEVPGALGAMDRQALTLQGRFSTFKDTIKLNFSNALQSSLPGIGQALLDVTATIDKQLNTLAPAIGNALTGIAPLLSGLVNTLAPIFTAFLNTLTPAFAALAPALQPLGAAFANLITALGPTLIPFAGALANIFIALADLLVKMTPAIVSVAQAFVSLLSTIAENKTLVEGITIALLGLFAGLKIGAVITTLATAFSAFSGSLVITALRVEGVSAAMTALKIVLLENPITAVAVALAALGTALFFFFTRANKAQEAADNLNKSFRGLTTSVEVLDAAQESLKKLGGLANVIDLTGISAEQLTADIDSLKGQTGYLGDELKKAVPVLEATRDKLNQLAAAAVVAAYDFARSAEAAGAKLYFFTQSVDGVNAVANAFGSVQNAIDAIRGKAGAAARDIAALIINTIIGLNTLDKAVGTSAAGDIQLDARFRHGTKVLNDLKGSLAQATAIDKFLNQTAATSKPTLFGGLSVNDALNKKKGGAGSAQAAANKAASAAKRALVKLADAALAAAKKISTGLKKELDKATSQLDKLKAKFNEIRDAIVNAFKAPNLFDSRSAGQFIKRATRNITQNTTVLQNEKTLQGALGKQQGGSEFLRQLFESGNVRLIKNLAAQSSATLNEVLAKFNADNALALKIGNAVAGAFIVGGRPLAIGIHNVQLEIIRLQKLLVAALAKVEAATRARNRLKAAAGGIFNSATDLQVGEAGAEVVVPLTRPGAALDLLLRSGALGLPNVAAHLASLQTQGNAESRELLNRINASSQISNGPLRVPSNPGSGRVGLAAPAPILKIVKERTINQEFHITEAGDAHVTAAKIAARSAAHIDR